MGGSGHAANHDERCYSISGDNTTIVLGVDGCACVFRFTCDTHKESCASVLECPWLTTIGCTDGLSTIVIIWKDAASTHLCVNCAIVNVLCT